MYKGTALPQSGYRYFKVRAKQGSEFVYLSKKKLSKFSNNVNEALNVISNWDRIVANLTDGRMTQIDVRRFSL